MSTPPTTTTSDDQKAAKTRQRKLRAARLHNVVTTIFARRGHDFNLLVWDEDAEDMIPVSALSLHAAYNELYNEVYDRNGIRPGVEQDKVLECAYLRQTFGRQFQRIDEKNRRAREEERIDNLRDVRDNAGAELDELHDQIGSLNSSVKDAKKVYEQTRKRTDKSLDRVYKDQERLQGRAAKSAKIAAGHYLGGRFKSNLNARLARGGMGSDMRQQLVGGLQSADVMATRLSFGIQSSPAMVDAAIDAQILSAGARAYPGGGRAAYEAALVAAGDDPAQIASVQAQARTAGIEALGGQDAVDSTRTQAREAAAKHNGKTAVQRKSEMVAVELYEAESALYEYEKLRDAKKAALAQERTAAAQKKREANRAVNKEKKRIARARKNRHSPGVFDSLKEITGAALTGVPERSADTDTHYDVARDRVLRRVRATPPGHRVPGS